MLKLRKYCYTYESEERSEMTVKLQKWTCPALGQSCESPTAFLGDGILYHPNFRSRAKQVDYIKQVCLAVLLSGSISALWTTSATRAPCPDSANYKP